jgi:hypothetical protein
MRNRFILLFFMAGATLMAGCGRREAAPALDKLIAVGNGSTTFRGEKSGSFWRPSQDGGKTISAWIELAKTVRAQGVEAAVRIQFSVDLETRFVFETGSTATAREYLAAHPGGSLNDAIPVDSHAEVEFVKRGDGWYAKTIREFPTAGAPVQPQPDLGQIFPTNWFSNGEMVGEVVEPHIIGKVWTWWVGVKLRVQGATAWLVLPMRLSEKTEWSSQTGDSDRNSKLDPRDPPSKPIKIRFKQTDSFLEIRSFALVSDN